MQRDEKAALNCLTYSQQQAQSILKNVSSAGSHFYAPQIVRPHTLPIVTPQDSSSSTPQLPLQLQALQQLSTRHDGTDQFAITATQALNDDALLSVAVTNFIRQQLLAQQHQDPKAQIANEQVFCAQVQTMYGRCSMTVDFRVIQNKSFAQPPQRRPRTRSLKRMDPMHQQAPIVVDQPQMELESAGKVIQNDNQCCQQANHIISIDPIIVEKPDTRTIASENPNQNSKLAGKDPMRVTLPEEREVRLLGRAKEITIREAVNKVGVWRQLWSGVLEGETVNRYSLDEAAKKIKMSRKTLDDYLLQLRMGKKCGFDFKSNQGSLIGTLRRFVRKQRCLEKKQINN